VRSPFTKPQAVDRHDGMIIHSANPQAKPTEEIRLKDPGYCAVTSDVSRGIHEAPNNWASLVGYTRPGYWVRVVRLVTDLALSEEWAYVVTIDAYSGRRVSGWVKLGHGALLYDNEDCRQRTPREYLLDLRTPQPNLACLIRARAAGIVYDTPLGTPLYHVPKRTVLKAQSRYDGGVYLWYRVWLPQDHDYGWVVADNFTNLTSECKRLPFVN
jgi:hypothetical protein